MTTDNFTPKGDVAEWRMLYDRIRSLDIGGILTYEDMDEILGRDFKEDRGPIYRCAKELEDNDHRTLAAVRNVGYRIVEPREHAQLATHHHRKSRRQLGKAVGKAASADRSKLTADERQRIDGLEMSLRRHADMIRRLDERTAKQADELKALRREKDGDVASLSERVDRLASLLERHGIEQKSA